MTGLASLLVVSALAMPPMQAVGEPVLQIPATSQEAEFTRPISRDLVLVVRRAVDVHGHHFGWDVSVHDVRTKRRTNLLFNCLCGHGPRPNDLYAWHFVEHYYPADRDLKVYGYPYDVLVRCEGCEVAATDSKEALFSGGTAKFFVRRLSTSNPRQLRINDVVKRSKK